MKTEWYPRERVPKRYRQWAADYDRSATLQSYNQLKSSAKYLFAKLKTGSVDEVAAESAAARNPEDAVNEGKVVLGNGGEVFLQSDGDQRMDILDWYTFFKVDKLAPSLDERPLFLFQADIIEPYKNHVLNKIQYPSSAFPLRFERYPCSRNLLCTFPTGSSVDQNSVMVSDSSSRENYRYVPLDMSKGIEYVWYSVESKDYFVVFDKTNSVLHVFEYGTAELVDKFAVEVCNSHPVFDLKGAVLMYVPRADASIDKKTLTPVNLSSKKTLLNKLIVTFSNTALDSMFLFSEVTQQKIKSIMEVDRPDGHDADEKSTEKQKDHLKNEKLKDNYRDIFTEIYNTISKNSAYVCAVDLATKKKMFQLSVPSGCSKLSISPFDLQFVTANNRGDELLLWDYTKAYDTIVLMDKYNRGKTSAIIDQIEWGTGNSSVICLSRQNGSLHYFVNESLRNYEDLKVRKTKKSGKTGHGVSSNGSTAHGRSVSSNSWCLSHLKLKSFKVVRPLLTKDFIVAVHQSNEVLTIDIETGCIDGVINLQKKLPHSETTSQSGTISKSASLLVRPEIESELLNQEIEVETCKPFLPAYNNKKFKFTEVNVTLGDSDVFNDIDSNTEVVKEYNVAAVLFQNKLRAKKITHSNNRDEISDQPLTETALRNPSKETLIHSAEEVAVEVSPRSLHESSSETLRETASQTLLQKAC